MDKDEKIKVAITAGIAGAILLILVLYLGISSVTHKSADDEQEPQETAAVSSSTVITENEAKEDAAAEATSGISTAADTASSEAASIASTTDNKKTSDISPKFTISGNSFYKTDTAVLKNVYKKMAYDVEAQLKEMYGYWNDGNMDAVSDLAHLERFEVMSYSLSGTKDFYYYGDKSESGVPEGKGIALYADDQYYFGEWHNGLRSGQGTWINFYPGYSDYVVEQHQFTGQWLDDLPNGEGQEHYDYDKKRMNEADLYIQNAIGGFRNGYYDGRMYIITVNNEYKTREWYGDAEIGNWKQVLYTYVDGNGRIAVLDEKDNAENHIWMSKEAASNNGISGIITGGKVVSK